MEAVNRISEALGFGQRTDVLEQESKVKRR